MNIDVLTFYSGDACFKIDTENTAYYTSESISSLLNLDVDFYNQLLIDKVIKHEKYDIEDFPYGVSDLSFDLNGTDKETYLKRFKETFAEQLMLLALGGD